MKGDDLSHPRRPAPTGRSPRPSPAATIRAPAPAIPSAELSPGRPHPRSDTTPMPFSWPEGIFVNFPPLPHAAALMGEAGHPAVDFFASADAEEQNHAEPCLPFPQDTGQVREGRNCGAVRS